MPSTLELGGQGLYSRQEGAASPAMDCQGNQGQADRHVSLLLSCQRLVVVPLRQVQVLQTSSLSCIIFEHNCRCSQCQALRPLGLLDLRIVMRRPSE